MNRHHPMIRAVAVLMVFLMLYSSAGVREFFNYCIELSRSIKFYSPDKSSEKASESADECPDLPDITLAYNM